MTITTLDFTKLVDEYISQNSWKAKATSNSNYSLSGLISHTSASVLANYALRNVYSAEASKAHAEGFIHIHDLVTTKIVDERLWRGGRSN
jgi:ribonucleoside-triphosphate reductase